MSIRLLSLLNWKYQNKLKNKDFKTVRDLSFKTSRKHGQGTKSPIYGFIKLNSKLKREYTWNFVKK